MMTFEQAQQHVQYQRIPTGREQAGRMGMGKLHQEVYL